MVDVKLVPPFRGEFGLKLYWQVPAVHAIEGLKVVYHEEGEEALYPSAAARLSVPRNDDGKRRAHYRNDQAFVDMIAARARKRLGDSVEYVQPDQSWPRKRFLPRPHEPQGVTCDVVVCPRKRDYGAEKNWPHWENLTEHLMAEGLDVFAGGAKDSSYHVDCPRAWDYKRNLDATIEAMQSAKLVVATDAGLAHLAVLCGAPLLVITHDKGLIAPGPVVDEYGKVLEPHYWPVRTERFTEADHTSSGFNLLHDAWDDPALVLGTTLETVKC